MLSFATVRERWHTFAGGFVVLFLGTALVSMSVLALASAGPRVPDRLAGTPVFVTVPKTERADGNFAPDRPWSPAQVTALLNQLKSIPEVTHAIPDQTFYAQPIIEGRPAPSERGHAWSTAMLAPYPLTAGAAPREGEVVLNRSLGLAPGAQVSVLTVHGPATYTVSGTVDGPGVYLNDSEAARISAGIRAIGLITAPGANIPSIADAARRVSAPAWESSAGIAKAERNNSGLISEHRPIAGSNSEAATVGGHPIRAGNRGGAVVSTDQVERYDSDLSGKHLPASGSEAGTARSAETDVASMRGAHGDDSGLIVKQLPATGSQTGSARAPETHTTSKHQAQGAETDLASMRGAHGDDSGLIVKQPPATGSQTGSARAPETHTASKHRAQGGEQQPTTEMSGTSGADVGSSDGVEGGDSDLADKQRLPSGSDSSSEASITTMAVAKGISEQRPTIGKPGASIAVTAHERRSATEPLAVAVVLTGDDRSALEPQDDERTRWIGLQVLTGMAVLSALVSVLVVGSTLAVGVAQRRREFGLLRAIGATPRQVRAMVYGEALVVGVAATAAGVAAGALLAPLLGAVLVDVGFEPEGFTVALSPLPIAGSFAAGVAGTLVAVWSASRRAAKVAPLEALREAEVDDRPMPRVRWIIGLALCALGVASAAGSDPEGAFVMSGLVAAIGVISGLALLSPVVVPPLARVLSWPLTRGRGAIGMLVRENARTSVRRTAATATPVLVTVGCAVLITGMVQTTAAGFAAVRATTIRADAVIVPDGTPGLTDASSGESSLFSALFEPNGDPLSAIGATPELLSLAGNTTGPLEELRRDDRILVADWLAEDRGLQIGSTLPVSFEDGTSARLTVAGTVQDAGADVLISRDLLRRHDPAVLADEAFVVGAAPAPGPGTRVVDVTAFAAEADAEEDRLVWIATLLLVVVSTAYAGVAIVNTMVMSAAGRGRDLEVLRLSGATPQQVRGTLAAESVLVVLLGAGLGAVVALPALLGIRGAFATAMRADVPLVIPWPLILGVIAACLVLAAGASVLAARSATTKVGA